MSIPCVEIRSTDGDVTPAHHASPLSSVGVNAFALFVGSGGYGRGDSNLLGNDNSVLGDLTREINEGTGVCDAEFVVGLTAAL